MGDALDIDLVLVPVDGSEESVTAVEYAVAIAAEYDAEVHAVYVLGEEVTRAIETGAVEDTSVAADTEAFVDTAADIAAESGVHLASSIAYGFSTKLKTRHPGSVVLDTAEEIEADFVVVPREPVSGDPGEVLEKAAEYVLLYASQPVLSV
jgi:nucleotide-binding universal stress UspA family protein